MDVDKEYWSTEFPSPYGPSEDDVIIFSEKSIPGKTLLLGCTKKLIPITDVQMDNDPWYDGPNVITKDWLDNTLKILRANSDRPIKIRNKGYNPLVAYNKQGHLIVNGKDNTPPSDPIVWEKVHAIVTYNSNITLEATSRGIPCFTDAHNACAPISETDFTKIESPRYPDREPCYHSLAYGQFTAEEMSNGYAWKVLNES